MSSLAVRFVRGEELTEELNELNAFFMELRAAVSNGRSFEMLHIDTSSLGKQARNVTDGVCVLFIIAMARSLKP